MAKNIRIVAFGFQVPITCKTIDRINAHSNMELVAWFGDATEYGSYGDHPTIRQLDNGDFEATPAPYDKEKLDALKADFLTFACLYNRTYEKYQQHTLFHMEGVFMRLFYYFYRFIEEKKPDVVVFSYPPHSPCNYVFYRLLKLFGIQTICFRESSFPKKIFYYEDVEDFGFFKNVPTMSEPGEGALHHGYDVKWFLFEKGDMYSKFDLKTTLKKRLQKSDIVRVFGSALRQDGFPFRHFYLPFLRYHRFRKYRKNLRDITTRDVNFDRPYVYFALNYQPEVTTSLFGGGFQDMALALEALSSFVPEGWVIYVKDHPRQSGYQREPQFFKRIKALSNVVFVPTNTSSLALIEHSQFVSTVSGSVGWEAVSGGKNALVFGLPWYVSYPGIFQYSSSLKVDDILNYTLKHEDLEAHHSKFQTHLADGTLEVRPYASFGPHNPAKVDPDENADFLFAIIEKLAFR